MIAGQGRGIAGMENDIATAVLDGRTRAAVAAVLGSVGMVQDIDDVISDAAEAAVKSADSFDPDKGHVLGWVITIAKRRAFDHVKRAGTRGRLQGQLEVAATGPDTALGITEKDFSQDVVDRLAGSAHARNVLGLTAQLVANPESFHRVTALVETYQGDVGKAAAALGITPEALRDSRREVSRCARVVVKALAARTAGEPVTVGTLVDCLPADGGEEGAWATAFSMAVVRAGGFGNVTAADLVAVTGYSLNTCRQYVVEALWLLQVARTVLENQNT